MPSVTGEGLIDCDQLPRAVSPADHGFRMRRRHDDQLGAATPTIFCVDAAGNQLPCFDSITSTLRGRRAELVQLKAVCRRRATSCAIAATLDNVSLYRENAGEGGRHRLHPPPCTPPPATSCHQLQLRPQRRRHREGRRSIPRPGRKWRPFMEFLQGAGLIAIDAAEMRGAAMYYGYRRSQHRVLRLRHRRSTMAPISPAGRHGR